MSFTKPSYAYVALLDVLGYRSLLNRDYNEGQLTFQSRLKKALDVLTSLNETIYQYQAISDTIIIICGDREGFLEFAKILQRLSASFLRQHLMIRGGIAYSQHFHSGNVTYSHALSLAYKIESEIALYPRIVVDSNILKLQEEIDVTIPKGILLNQNGTIFIDFISYMQWDTAYDLAKSIYLEHRDELVGNEKYFSKHFWLHNLLSSHPSAPSNAEAYIDSPNVITVKGTTIG